jgi:hypothetical protein
MAAALVIYAAVFKGLTSTLMCIMWRSYRPAAPVATPGPATEVLLRVPAHPNSSNRNTSFLQEKAATYEETDPLAPLVDSRVASSYSSDV